MHAIAMICDQRWENLHHGIQKMLPDVHIMSSSRKEVEASSAITTQQTMVCSPCSGTRIT